MDSKAAHSPGFFPTYPQAQQFFLYCFFVALTRLNKNKGVCSTSCEEKIKVMARKADLRF